MSEPVRRRAERVLADRAMLAELERIRLDRADTKDTHFDAAAADPAYARAFREYGIDVDVDGAGRRRPRGGSGADDRGPPGGGGGRLGGQPPARPDGGRGRVDAVAGGEPGGRPDPWRAALRQAAAARDRPALQALARSPGLAEQPPASLVLLADLLKSDGDPAGAVSVLQAGHRRHPDDLWVNHDLAMALAVSKPPRTEEAVGFFRAADNGPPPAEPGDRLNLGNVLGRQGRRAEAVDCYREAVRLGQPGFATAHYNLGNELAGEGRQAEAAACYREAVRPGPTTRTHANRAWPCPSWGSRRRPPPPAGRPSASGRTTPPTTTPWGRHWPTWGSWRARSLAYRGGPPPPSPTRGRPPHLGIALYRQGSCRRHRPTLGRRSASSPTSRRPTSTWRG
ncbi:MAG: tetratricopeptide repeat protein [Gemmataceae bacterium]